MLKTFSLHFKTIPVRRLLLLLLFVMAAFLPHMLQAQCYDYKLKPDLKNGRYGAIEQATGKLIIPHQFQAAQVFPGNFMLVADKYQGDKTSWGLVNEAGKLVLPMKYARITAPKCGYISARAGDTVSLLNNRLILLSTTVAEWVNPYPKFNRLVSLRKLNDTLSEVKLADLKTGKVYYQQNAFLISNVIMQLGGEHRRELPFFQVQPRRPNGKTNPVTTLIDVNGKTLFDSVEWLGVDRNITLIQRKNTTIVADSSFKIWQPLSYKFEFLRPLTPAAKWFWVTKNGRTGVVDRQARVLIPISHEGQFTYIGKKALLFHDRNTSQHTRIFFLDGRTIDLTDHFLNTGIDTTLLSRPLILTHKKLYKFGLMDLNGSFILPQVYDNLAYSAPNQLIYFKGNESGFMDLKGKVLLSGNYKALSSFFEGFAAAEVHVSGSRKDYPTARITHNLDGGGFVTQYTFIDSTGKKFPGGYYDFVSGFKGGFARVLSHDNTFMIDQQGKKVTYGLYTLYSHFSGDVALITNKAESKFGLIHRNGKILTEPIYDKIETEHSYPAYNRITAAKNAYSSNLQAFTYPKIVNGKVKATLIQQSPYSQKDVFLDITP